MNSAILLQLRVRRSIRVGFGRRSGEVTSDADRILIFCLQFIKVVTIIHYFNRLGVRKREASNARSGPLKSRDEIRYPRF